MGEVRLYTAHSAREQEILGFQTTDADSFIKRIRRKSGVYGEHILFPMTVQGLEWVAERRKRFAGYSPSAQLILNEKGKPLDQQTKGSNTNQTIPNQFAKLIKRIQNDGKEIRDLSFGKMRKTASDLIKRHSTGEIAGVFDCHGEPVKTDSLSDVYTNRPFGKVFQTIRDVQKYLEPVFLEAGSTPFAPQTQAYTKRSVIERIIELHEQGQPTDKIAAAVGVSGQTVSRHVQQHVKSNLN
ncbi:MAG: Resolvase helix-turn-helix domain protein [Schlesneria sp.]|nr:Resolvase helix-turn-helix domain protein [Schlesneria sp.]